MSKDGLMPWKHGIWYCPKLERVVITATSEGENYATLTDMRKYFVSYITKPSLQGMQSAGRVTVYRDKPITTGSDLRLIEKLVCLWCRKFMSESPEVCVVTDWQLFETPDATS